jgi:hypothetical protein
VKLCGDTVCLCARWDGTREGETRLVADSYRSALHRIAQSWSDDPAADLQNVDRFWHDHGVHWPVPTPQPVEIDAWMSAADIVVHLAHLTTFTARDVRDWHYRGRISSETAPDGSPRYNVGEVLGYLTRRRKRAG